ncbi:hypothetical protein IFT84_11195 [Rhizobium sp. CFBP 8762]|uniref:hypothetical protein n=1 Tax=Rhizobium sp. CFBP 8762 TaxID=2775279 RepID=UPI00177C0F87|nr:hypothetical protein [Rhizobium sp. CFBP 8762]MBD8555090.1 hypothetical protein [Rhizobium sp. CFBP 8762]
MPDIQSVGKSTVTRAEAKALREMSKATREKWVLQRLQSEADRHTRAVERLSRINTG